MRKCVKRNSDRWDALQDRLADWRVRRDARALGRFIGDDPWYIAEYAISSGDARTLFAAQRLLRWIKIGAQSEELDQGAREGLVRVNEFIASARSF